MPFHLNRIRCSWFRYAMGVCALLAAVAVPRAFGQVPLGTYPIGSNTRTPDANDIMTMNQEQAKKRNFEAANLERKRQIADDAALLLQLATELKAEVTKTGKDSHSDDDIRRAETIEKLAKDVKDKMQLIVGAS